MAARKLSAKLSENRAETLEAIKLPSRLVGRLDLVLLSCFSENKVKFHRSQLVSSALSSAKNRVETLEAKKSSTRPAVDSFLCCFPSTRTTTFYCCHTASTKQPHTPMPHSFHPNHTTNVQGQDSALSTTYHTCSHVFTLSRSDVESWCHCVPHCPRRSTTHRVRSARYCTDRSARAVHTQDSTSDRERVKTCEKV
ncbi:unnamed protein product [Trichogramma brassicae]|uniref:Uncharacterized protein n=1 Tax=Trichogramma brassicae TaxID=86971 RepID=A0A6H5I7R5_9HYME|nr:unnamed protein product [Trichogramma brassicae]